MGDVGVGSAELPRVLAARDAPESDAPPPRAAHHDPAEKARIEAADKVRLTAIVHEHFDFIWRSLRRLGVPGTDVDDCAQQVFWVASRKLGVIAVGSERSFLFSTALRVASDERRGRHRRREVPEDDEVEPCDPSPRPDEIVDSRQARALLDDVLSELPMELRAVFVLFELEEMSTPEIAALVGVPVGTAASRLRRAREEFQKIVNRMRASSSSSSRWGRERPQTPAARAATSSRWGRERPQTPAASAASSDGERSSNPAAKAASEKSGDEE